VSVLIQRGGCECGAPGRGGCVFDIGGGAWDVHGEVQRDGYEEVQVVTALSAGKTAAQLPDVSMEAGRGTLHGTFTLAGATSHAGSR